MKQLTINEYCDLFMKRIYDVAKEKGTSELQKTEDMALHFNLTDLGKVHNIFSIILSTGLIQKLYENEDGTFGFFITGRGEHYVETGGRTGIIKSYLANSNMYNDQSVNIGNIGTNYGIASSGSNNTLTQNLTINDPQQILSALEQIKVKLKSSDEHEDTKADGLLTIDSIQTELKKKKPMTSMINQGISFLSDIASIASFVKSFFPNGTL